MDARGNWQGGSLAPGQYMRSQLATIVGVSVDSIKRWQGEGLLIALGRTPGISGHYIFDAEALRRARFLAAHRNLNIESRRIMMNHQFGTQGVE